MRCFYVTLCVFMCAVLLEGSKLEMPSYAIPGEKIVIECKLDHEKSDIEHIKWYKNNQLFYVIVPKKDDPATNVDIEGIRIDKDESKMDRVVLSPITEESAGLYTCELKTEDGLVRMSGTLTVRSVKE